MTLIQSQIFNSQLNDYEVIYEFPYKKPFSPMARLNPTIIKEVFRFSYAKTFENKRVCSLQEDHDCKISENFAILSQRKLAEFSFWKYLTLHHIPLDKPNLKSNEQEKIHSNDFTFKFRNLAIKSAAATEQALLLATKDWNKKGLYIPHIGTSHESYNYFVLVRLNHSIVQLMKDYRHFNCSNLDKDQLYRLIMSQTYTYDIPGFITKQDLIDAINNECFIPEGVYLDDNKETSKMVLSYYYFQAGNLQPIQKLIANLRQL